MVRLTLLITLLFAAHAQSQTLAVLPASHSAVEGTTNTNVPFGRSSAVRVQCAYDRLLFSGPGTITELAFRFDGNVIGAGKIVDCEMRLSTMAVSLVAMSTDFATNRGADETIVLPRTLLTLAGQATAAAPSPFLSPIQLSVPFAYNPNGGALLLEILVYSQPPGSYSLDATFVCDSPEIAFGPTACAPPTGIPLRVESASTQVLWGYPLVIRTFDAVPNSLVMLSFGTLEASLWNGLLLPYDLTSFGAPSCYLATDPSAVFFHTSQGDGSSVFTFSVPNMPRLIGTWLRYQAGNLNASANALGVITSVGKKMQICGFEPVARVWASGVTSTVGVREMGVAPVLQIRIL
ncbi:MAG: hypothetical protein EXS02_10655 [Planctomycetes bacterium]|nr:hypothetical protein [Planctomycetota bacterium]